MFDNVRRVARQLVAYGTADVTTLALNALLLPFFLDPDVLGPAEIGAFGILLGWEAIIRIVFRWGLEGAFLRLYYEQPDEASKRRLAGTIAILLAIANGALLVLLVAASGLIDRLFFRTQALQWAFVLLVVNCFISGFFFLPMTLYRAREQATRAAAVTLARSLGTIVLRLLLVLGLRMGVVGLMIADVIVSLGLAIGLAGTFRRMLRLEFSPAFARDALNFGLPHVPFGLLHQSAVYADRFFLGLWLPAARLEALGAYTIAVTAASLLKLAPVAFQTAWMPFAFETFKKRPDAPRVFARLATYWLAVLVFLTIGMMTLAGRAITLFLPASYAEAAAYLPVLAFGFAIQAASWLPTTSLNIAKATRYYPIITSMSATTAIAANAVLIPRFDVTGAAYAMAIGQLVQLVATLVYSQRAYSIPYETARLAKILGVGAVTLALASSISFTADAWTLAVRTVMLGLFPVGLFAVRLFTPKERADLRALVDSVARPRPARVEPAPPPADETVL
jgi:O-antigen/teichoic acid export membrane protein